MKYLLLVVSLCVQVSVAQKKPTVHYIVKQNSSYNRNADEKTYHLAVEKVKKLSKQRDLMQLRIYGFENKNGDRIFSTEDLDKGENFLTSTAAISNIYGLKKPFQFTVDKGVVSIDTLKWKDEIKQQLTAWEIKDDVIENALKNTFSEYSNLLQSLYFAEISSLDESALKTSDITKNGMIYHMVKQDKSVLAINYSHSDSASTLEGSTSVDPKTHLVIDESRKSNYSFLDANGKKSSGQFTNSIQRASNYTAAVIENDYYDMIITGSYWSNAVNTKDQADSLKVHRYIDLYEAKYAGNRDYVKNKLGHLQKLRNKQYDDALSSKLLAGTYHLSNRVTSDNISDHDFKEIIPLLNDVQLFDYLQHSLSQYILSLDSASLQKAQLIANQLSERERVAARPMYLWATAMQIKDVDSLKQIQNEILNMDNAYWNQGNAGRYALLIQKLLSEHAGYDTQAMQKIIDKISVLYEDESNKKRFLQKAHLAYAYYLAYEMTPVEQEDGALLLLEKAAYYSPKSAAEKEHGSFYDRVFLKSKENYNEDYMALLSKKGKKDIALQNYIQEFLNNPASSFKSLSTFYRENYDESSFSHFFKKEIVSKLADAPSFLLKDIQGNEFSSAQLSGKWTVIDFWGTWCGPCVAEMPKLNQYYLGLKEDNLSKINFMSIACSDTKEKVQRFLSNNNYEIPVLMSDSKVEQSYKVRGYPSKYIITPEGKLIPTEFGFNWENLVSELSKL
jgi:thiol-disulfide isomerase/thioredoxin